MRSRDFRTGKAVSTNFVHKFRNFRSGFKPEQESIYDDDEENARIGALIDALIACLSLETEEEKTRTKILIKALEAAKTVEA